MDKRCKVVLLPTNEKATFGDIILTPDTNKLLIFEHQRCTEVIQHLYITSDDKIKDGDWYDDSYGNIRQAITIKTEYSIAHKKMVINVYYGENINSYHTLHEQMRKIIATTDDSLTIKRSTKSEYCNNSEDIECHLPQPSQSFIQKYVDEYNKGNQIVDVLVEYEAIGNWRHAEFVHTRDIPKVNPKDNTITIRRVKDSWNREEVIELLQEMNSSVPNLYSQMDDKEFDEWIEENL